MRVVDSYAGVGLRHAMAVCNGGASLWNWRTKIREIGECGIVPEVTGSRVIYLGQEVSSLQETSLESQGVISGRDGDLRHGAGSYWLIEISGGAVEAER